MLGPVPRFDVVAGIGLCFVAKAGKVRIFAPVQPASPPFPFLYRRDDQLAELTREEGATAPTFRSMSPGVWN